MLIFSDITSICSDTDTSRGPRTGCSRRPRTGTCIPGTAVRLKTCKEAHWVNIVALSNMIRKNPEHNYRSLFKHPSRQYPLLLTGLFSPSMPTADNACTYFLSHEHVRDYARLCLAKMGSR